MPLTGWILGRPISWVAMLATPDLLFLVIIWLAATIDWTVVNLLLTPKTKAKHQGWHYFWFVISTLGIVALAIQLGVVLLARMTDVTPTQNIEIRSAYNVFVIVCGGIYAAGRYYSWLLEGNL